MTFAEEVKVLYPNVRRAFHMSGPTSELMMRVRLRDDPSISGTRIIPSAPGTTLDATLRVSDSFGSFGLHAAEFLQQEQRELAAEATSRQKRREILQNALEQVRQDGARGASSGFAFLGLFGTVGLVYCGIAVEPEEAAVPLTLTLGFVMCWVGCFCTLAAAAGFNFATNLARWSAQYGSLVWLILCCLGLIAGAVRYADAGYWWIVVAPGLVCCCCLSLVCLAVHRPESFQARAELKQDIERSLVFQGSVLPGKGPCVVPRPLLKHHFTFLYEYVNPIRNNNDHF